VNKDFYMTCLCRRYSGWIILRASRLCQRVRVVFQHPDQERRLRHLLRLAESSRISTRTTRIYV